MIGACAHSISFHAQYPRGLGSAESVSVPTFAKPTTEAVNGSAICDDINMTLRACV